MKVGRTWRLGGLVGDDVGDAMGEDSMGLGFGLCAVQGGLERYEWVVGLLVRMEIRA